MGQESADAIRSWCLQETVSWHGRGLRFATALPTLREWNQTSPQIALFRIADGRVEIAAKARALSDYHRRRRSLYLGFLRRVVETRCPALDTLLAMGVDDYAPASDTFPVFSFQKPVGSAKILLPDVDFLLHEFYEGDRFRDDIPYGEKHGSAIFVGSTTGGRTITADAVRALSVPRLRAAVGFRAHPEIAFELPAIVQCDTPETAALIAALGLGQARRSWQEQFAHRFLISMDGNGATCSRVAIALKSQGVLLKYDSPHLLYYFRHLVPWRHYIPIAADADIERVIAMERATPGLFRFIAEAGRRFHAEHLRREPVMDYTAALLRAYAALVEDRPGTAQLDWES